MFDFENPDIIFGWALCSYFIPLLIGFIVGKVKKIKMESIYKIGQKLSDPLTLKIHNWSRKYKLNSIKNNNWILLFILIFLNNLILVAFVSRILYGVIFFIPLLLNIWTGFAQGILFSKKNINIPVPLIFEFAGYIFASVIGISFGKEVIFELLKKGSINYTIPWKYALYSTLFIFMGALSETLMIIMSSKQADFSNIDKIDFEKRKEELIKKIDE